MISSFAKHHHQKKKVRFDLPDVVEDKVVEAVKDEAVEG
jgi:hypothetical protein